MFNLMFNPKLYIVYKILQYQKHAHVVRYEEFNERISAENLEFTY